MSVESDLLGKQFDVELRLIEGYLHFILKQWVPASSGAVGKLKEAIQYSLFSNGKRFRPLLSLLTAKALNHSQEEVLPLAAAVELIHTYSLVHDDLPLMDNDDLRRGMPTNHKVFGEAMALLAGDGLLTLAFYVIAKGLAGHPRGLEVSLMVAKASGIEGMVGGQALDIATKDPSEEMLDEIHRLKTGALIQVAVDGAVTLLGANPEETKHLSAYGRSLGLAFQLADDLQDAGHKLENINFVHRLGPEQTIQVLRKETDAGLQSLSGFGDSAEGLRFLLNMNKSRISL